MLVFSHQFRPNSSIARIRNALNLPSDRTTSIIARMKLDFPMLTSRKSNFGIAAERREILAFGTGLGARTGSPIDKFGGEREGRGNQGKENRADHRPIGFVVWRLGLARKKVVVLYAPDRISEKRRGQSERYG